MKFFFFITFTLILCAPLRIHGTHISMSSFNISTLFVDFWHIRCATRVCVYVRVWLGTETMYGCCALIWNAVYILWCNFCSYNQMNETYQHPGKWHDILLIPTLTRSTGNHYIMSHVIRGLEGNSVYEAIVQAKNRYGWNEVMILLYSFFFFRSQILHFLISIAEKKENIYIW